MILEWMPAALADRDAIYDFISADNRHAALHVDATIEHQVDGLLTYPQRGRQGRIGTTRELVISGLPYIVAYAVNNDRIRILRVLHAAQAWPDELG